KRGGAVVFHAAVIQMERLDNPPGLIILLARQRLAVLDRARVKLRMVVVGHCYGRQRFLTDSVVMHETALAQCHPLCGTIKAVGSRIRGGAGPMLRNRGLPKAPELALRQSA